MRYLITLFVFVLLASTASAMQQGCAVGIVKDSVGLQPLSFVLNADQSVAVMAKKEAKTVAGILNARHNNDANGVEAVMAVMYCN